MSKTKFSKKKRLQLAITVVLFVLLLSVALLLLSIWERKQGTFPSQQIEEVSSSLNYGGVEYKLKDNVESVLVLGLDKFGGTSGFDAYNNDEQSDFLLLFVIDNDASECAALQINRDTMADINVLGVAGETVATVNKQIALAHTYGKGGEISCRNTADAVSALLLNVPVKQFVSLTMDAVPVFNDLCGGVTLEVLEDFSGIDSTLVKGETVKLLGKHALNYVRTRYGLEDSSNDTRMIRQRQYLEALYEQAMACIEKDEEFIVKASFELSDYLVSNRSVTQLQELLEKLSAYEFTGIRYLEGESVLGEQFMEFYPDEDSINKTVIELFYEPKE